MKFIEVKELPKKKPYNYQGKTERKSVKNYLREFMNMDIKYAKIEYNDREYKTYKSAHSALYNAIMRYGYPIEIRLINYEIYLIRKDI